MIQDHRDRFEIATAGRLREAHPDCIKVRRPGRRQRGTGGRSRRLDGRRCKTERAGNCG
jgi:hypothetical protein